MNELKLIKPLCLTETIVKIYIMENILNIIIKRKDNILDDIII